MYDVRCTGGNCVDSECTANFDNFCGKIQTPKSLLALRCLSSDVRLLGSNTITFLSIVAMRCAAAAAKRPLFRYYVWQRQLASATHWFTSKNFVYLDSIFNPSVLLYFSVVCGVFNVVAHGRFGGQAIKSREENSSGKQCAASSRGDAVTRHGCAHACVWGLLME